MSLDQRPKNLVLKTPTKLNLADFELSKVLGEGAFGKVKLAKDLKTGEYIALKQLNKLDIIRMKQIDHVKNENFILTSLSHPLIVKMIGLTMNARHLYIGMEFIAGGELFTYLRSVGKFSASQSAFYAGNVALMFEYLHSLNVIYRDLKPENLLINPDGYLKLTDFGFAKVVEGRTFTLCGTPEYLAPEILLNKGYGKGVDWWTLGILLYEMIAGIDPFNDSDPMGIYQKILRGRILFSKTFNKNARSLIKHLLIADLSKRYGNLKRAAQDIKNHRFFDIINWKLMLQKKIVAPYIPKVKSMNDTSNFRTLGIAADKDTPEINPAKDPFLSWCG